MSKPTSLISVNPQQKRQRRSSDPSELKHFLPVPCGFLLMPERKDLDEEEQGQLDRLLTVSAEGRTVHALLHAFLTMVRERNHQPLRSWMQEASTSGLAELKSFVAGVERDFDAVKEALRQPWSQGPTEGKVNTLKTIKRVMYGRAGFPLLRRRLLLDA